MAKNLWRRGITKAQIEHEMTGVVPQVKRIELGRPMSELIDRFDDVSKVKKAMKALPKDHFCDDDEMRRKCAVSLDRWKMVAQHPAITGYRYQLPRDKVVWMHPEAQVKLTAAINLDQN